MPGQLDEIANSLYNQADELHKIVRQLVYKTRNGKQQPIIPDWYPVIGATVHIVHNMQDILGHIPDIDANREHYYDDRDQDTDPTVVSREATETLRLARLHLARLDRALNLAWSAIGHIGLRTPTGDDNQ